MTALHGEIQPYLDALGTEDGSEKMIAAMEAVGTAFTIDEFTSTGVEEKYLEFRRGGVEFLVVDGILDTVFFNLVEDEYGAAYPRPEALIPGVHHGMSRQAAIELLGTPRRDEPKYLLFAVGERFLNLRIHDEQVVGLTVLCRDLAAEYETSEAPVESVTISGEITQFLDATGTGYGDPAMAELIATLGPRFDSHPLDDEYGKGILLIFGSSGVDLQYRDGVLQGVLIHAADVERVPYPRLDALIDGLSFPASSDAVAKALGPSHQTLEDTDIYFQDGRHIILSYTDSVVTTISIVKGP